MGTGTQMACGPASSPLRTSAVTKSLGSARKPGAGLNQFQFALRMH